MNDDKPDNSEIIERIYDVAIDPSRLEELVDVWEERIAPQRLQGDVFNDKTDTTFAHFSRMGQFLDRLQFSDTQEIINEIANTSSLAAILVCANLKIKQLNDAAINLFNLQIDDFLTGITPDQSSQETLKEAVENAVTTSSSMPSFLRFRLQDSERFILVQIRGIEPHAHDTKSYGFKKPLGLKSISATSTSSDQRLALIVTTELAWQPSFSKAIQNAFDLTTSEVEIIRALTEGHTIDSIAKSRNRSKATVRTQIRSIFEKTETRSQAELVRISLSLMDMTNFAEEQVEKTKNDMFKTPTLSATVFHSITRQNSRRYDHIILGDPKGKPILFFAGDYGLIRWPATAEAEAKARGIKVIVPIRGGYGKSGELPPNIDYIKCISDDFIALMDHHDIASCAIISQQTDFFFATMFAARHPDRISAIVACAPLMPLWKKEQYERMDKWYRFIMANARYAPKILPYLVKAGFYLALSIGQHAFMNAIFSESKADLDTYADSEIFEAIITGATITLSKEFTAHKIFARECIIQAKAEWVTDLKSLKNKVPIHAFMGENSPMVPLNTQKEFQHRYDWIDFHILPDAGELVFFKYWRDILDFSDQYINTSKK